jgi:hypothetical protein
MDYGFIAYVLVAVVIILATFSTLMNSNRMWAAILSLVLFILIFTFYGMRWFQGTKSKYTYTGQWPPIINMCPDYLVYFKRSATKESCIDMVGVSSLTKWSDEDTKNPPTNDDNAKYFNYVYKPGMTSTQLKVLCDKAIEKGMTWEGITNGESCTFKV